MAPQCPQEKNPSSLPAFEALDFWSLFSPISGILLRKFFLPRMPFCLTHILISSDPQTLGLTRFTQETYFKHVFSGFPCSPVVKILPFQCRGHGGGGMGSIPGQGTKIPHASWQWHGQKKKKSIFKPYSQKSNSVPVDPESEILETPTLSPHTMRNIFT